jgi:hypothetical protein
LEGSGEVNNRLAVTERGHDALASSKRSNLVRQLIEPPPQRGTYLSRCSGHHNGAGQSPIPNDHSRRQQDQECQRRSFPQST